MTADFDSSKKNSKSSLWSLWLGGLKNAWTQAKLEYQEERNKSKRRTISQSSQRARVVGKESKNGRDRVRGRGRGRRTPSQDLRMQTMTVQHRKKVERDESTPRLAEWSAADGETPSILNDTFLKGIRGDEQDSTVGNKSLVSVTESGSPSRKRKRDTLIAPPSDVNSDANESLQHHSLSSLGSEVDEEYVLRVQRRVLQLEAELEAARTRLALYERSAMQESMMQDAAEGLMEEQQQQRSSSQEFKENGQVGPVESTVKERIEQPIARTMEDDSFMLSPSKLALSPIRVELADVSNGEIARREAVQAMKERLVKSFTS